MVQAYDAPQQQRASQISVICKRMIKLLAVVLTLAFLSASVDSVPVGKQDAPPDASHAALENELYEILSEGLLNNTENVAKIQAAFETEPGAVKICVAMNYNITCSDSLDQDWCNGSDYLSEYIWTNFNIYSPLLSGYFLFFYASLNWDIFGFEWKGACDLKKQSNPFLEVDIGFLPISLSNENVTEYLERSLIKLTQQVSLSLSCGSFVQASF